MQEMKMEKARIKNVDTKEEFECHFNPNTYTFDKKNSWKSDQKTGGNSPMPAFDSGSPATLALELWFDTYTGAGTSTPPDVRQVTDKIWKLMLVDPNLKDKNYNKKNKKHRPPRVQFIWGKTWSFEGVITSLTQKFTLFLPSGVPVRAVVNMSMQQSQDEAKLEKQNPTSGGVGGDRLWTVTEGDTLGWIAYKELGDATDWRVIAEANHLEQVRRLIPGTTLVIPNG
jgi:hypothetical protein